MSEQASGNTHNGETTFLEVGPFYILKVWPPDGRTPTR